MVDLWVEGTALAVLIGLSGFFSGLRSSFSRGSKIKGYPTF